MYAGGEQQSHRQRIEYGDKRQSEQADWSLEVGGRCTDQLCEMPKPAGQARKRLEELAT